MGDRAAVPRSARREQPHPRPHLDRAGDLPRLCARGLARPRPGRVAVHPAGGADLAGDRLGLRAVRIDAGGDVAPVRDQARHHRGRAAGDLGAGEHRGQGVAARGRRRERPRALRRRIQRDRAIARGRAPRHGRPQRLARPPAAARAGARAGAGRACASGGGGLGRGRSGQPVLRVPEDRRGALWKRLRAARVPA